MDVLSDPTRRRWLGWSSLILAFLLVNVHRLSTGVLSGRLRAAFDVTATQLGTLHAAFFVIYAVMQIPTGVLADRYGARFVGAGGAAVMSAGAVGFALSEGYAAALLARGVVGLGGSVVFISTIRFCASWFRADEFGTMTGLTAGAAGLGAIVATTPLAVTVERLGWRTVMLAFGAVGFVAAALVWALVRRSPADAGLDPIPNVPDRPPVTLSATLDHLRRVLADPDQWLLSVVFFSAMGTILTVIGLWGVPYLVVVHGLDSTAASYFTLLGAVGMLVGGPGVGRLSDATGKRLSPLIVGLGIFAAALAVIPVLGAPPLAVVAGVYLVIGLSLGVTMLALSAIKERYPPEASGVATATVNGAGFVGGAVLPPLLGLVLDRYRTGEVVGGSVAYSEFGYRVAFGVTAVAVAVACCAAILFARRRRAERSEPPADR